MFHRISADTSDPTRLLWVVSMFDCIKQPALRNRLFGSSAFRLCAVRRGYFMTLAALRDFDWHTRKRRERGGNEPHRFQYAYWPARRERPGPSGFIALIKRRAGKAILLRLPMFSQVFLNAKLQAHKTVRCN